MSRYAPRSTEDVVELIREYPLGLLVTSGAEGSAATPLPLLVERGPGGEIESLFGHIARRNPQADLIARHPRALILFQGPQGYVSPRLVSNLTWGPTWNYAVVRFDVDIELIPHETDAAIRALAKHLEGEAWAPERMGQRYEQLLERIVAFRARVRSMEAKFKLGQDESRDTFEEIVSRIENTDLARWMTRVHSD